MTCHIFVGKYFLSTIRITYLWCASNSLRFPEVAVSPQSPAQPPTTFICIFSSFRLEGKGRLKPLLPGCKFCFIYQFCVSGLCVSFVFLNGESRMLGNIIWLSRSFWESERGRKLLFYCEVCQMISEKLWYHSYAVPSWIETAHLGRHLEWAYNSSGLVWAFIRNSSIGSIYITVVECENKHSCGIALNISIQRGIKRELYRWTTDKHNSSSNGQFNWGTK